VTAWRRQLPVHSPLDARAVFAGFRAITARNGAQERWEARVGALLQERYAARAVLLTESGTAALTATLLGVLQDRAGGAPAPIALPAYACYDVATAADGAGVPVFLYDVNPGSLGPDLTQVETALRHGARAIVVAHLYGCPVDLTAVNSLAAAAGAVVIEDAAQAAGASVNGHLAGSQASLTVLSFGRGKGLTGGSGGAVLAIDETGEQILDRVRRQHTLTKGRRGWSELAGLTAQWLFQHPSLYAIPAALPMLHLGETIYRAPRPLRAPAAVSCPVIAATWAAADQELNVRRHNAARLLEELRQQPAFRTVTTPTAARAGYLRLPVLASPLARHAAGGPAARNLGVMPGYPRALCDLEPFARRCVNRGAAFPGSRLLVERLCTFPTHGRLAARDLAGLERWIWEWGRHEAA
jgi:perosamine synthetase